MELSLPSSLPGRQLRSRSAQNQASVQPTLPITAKPRTKIILLTSSPSSSSPALPARSSTATAATGPNLSPAKSMTLTLKRKQPDGVMNASESSKKKSKVTYVPQLAEKKLKQMQQGKHAILPKKTSSSKCVQKAAPKSTSKLSGKVTSTKPATTKSPKKVYTADEREVAEALLLLFSEPRVFAAAPVIKNTELTNLEARVGLAKPFTFTANTANTKIALPSSSNNITEVSNIAASPGSTTSVPCPSLTRSSSFGSIISNFSTQVSTPPTFTPVTKIATTKVDVVGSPHRASSIAFSPDFPHGLCLVVKKISEEVVPVQRRSQRVGRMLWTDGDKK